MVYSTRRFVVCLSVCHFVLVFFSPFSIAITSLGEERANLSAFRTFVRFVLVWICRFPLPLGVWEGLRFVIVVLPGLFTYLFFPTNFGYHLLNCVRQNQHPHTYHSIYLSFFLFLQYFFVNDFSGTTSPRIWKFGNFIQTLDMICYIV